MIHRVRDVGMSIDSKMVIRLLGAKIAYFRTLAGLSQEELAVRIHSTQATISKIENGHYNDNLNIKLLVEIANALEVDFDMMLEFNKFERNYGIKKSHKVLIVYQLTLYSTFYEVGISRCRNK